MHNVIMQCTLGGEGGEGRGGVENGGTLHALRCLPSELGDELNSASSRSYPAQNFFLFLYTRQP